MRLEISKRYCSYSFHPIWAKFYDTYGSHRGIYSYRYLGGLAKFKNFVALSNFNMGVNGKPKMWNISKRPIVEGNGRKFGTRGTTVHMCRILLMPGTFNARFLEFGWGHSVHFAKFSMLRFSKGYCSPSFRSISTKFYY